MNTQNTVFKIPESSQENKSIFQKLILSNLIIAIILAIPIIITILKISFEELPIFYVIIAIIFLQISIFKLLKFKSKKVQYIEFQNNLIILKYKQRNQLVSSTLNLNSTQIQLIELKDYRSFFDGLQINLINERLQEKFKILDSEWNYDLIERIYLEFKSRKNENIPENEIRPFEQLQIMNGSKKIN